MLTSLLPGVRDLRAPLAAGYIWLLFGWLVVEPRYSSLGLSALFLNAISSPASSVKPEFADRAVAATVRQGLTSPGKYEARFEHGTTLERAARPRRISSAPLRTYIATKASITSDALLALSRASRSSAT